MLTFREMSVIIKSSDLPEIRVESIFILEMPSIAIDPKLKDRRIVGRNPPRSVGAEQFANKMGQKPTVGDDPEFIAIFMAVKDFQNKAMGTIADFH